uniref:Retrovirus-related Pol polyprotein from transposon TNT 1-94 n=1 Tax=Tanacetum cinerariifolium TaxID=118510 RepID=A0A6L2LWG0_TANCI|nr:hypothetical protein [Tanacetum cinerariifolium]
MFAAEKIQADCDLKAANIILQGLPSDIYSLFNHHIVAKDLWERIQLLMQGTSLTKQERECKLYGTRGNNSGQQRVVKCFNYQREGHMARQCPKPKRKRDATWLRDKVLLVEAQGSVKAVLMANLFSYGSNVLSEVPHSENTHNDMLNQSVKEMSYFE